MFKFAVKNMAIKKAKVVLIVISIVISASVALLAYNISEQVDSGFKSTAGYYDMIIGPSGSSTQLAMNTMFFTDAPLGTISYEYVEKLQKDERVNLVVPFTMGDSYNGAKIVGTTADFLEGKQIKEGEMFTETFHAVVGSAVAAKYGIEIGDSLVTTHGLSEGGASHDNAPLVVTGILRETKTAYDNVIFTMVETVWSVHDHSHDEEQETQQETQQEDFETEITEAQEDTHSHEEEDTHSHEEEDTHSHEDEDTHSHEEEDTHSHEEEDTHSHEDEDTHEEEHQHTHHGEVCAILVKTKSFNNYSMLKDEYSENSSLLVINPSEVLREVLENVDMSTKIVYILCIIILIMNIFIISVITLLNMYDSKKEIALMRLIGIGMGKINMLYIIQNGIIGLISTILAFLTSRLCLMLMGGYVASMGIVLDTAKIYSFEIIIMAIVFVISVLPTVICTVNMSKKDGVND